MLVRHLPWESKAIHQLCAGEVKHDGQMEAFSCIIVLVCFTAINPQMEKHGGFVSSRCFQTQV